MSGYERRNRKVFRRCLKTESDGEEVTSDGSSFHRTAPATGNDRLPMVLRRVNGIVRRLVEADLSLCRLGTSATRVKYDER